MFLRPTFTSIARYSASTYIKGNALQTIREPKMIDKNIDQITPEDIAQLSADGVYENQLLEFKRDLPGERSRPDPWLTGGDFTAYARDNFLREVIAFAN